MLSQILKQKDHLTDNSQSFFPKTDVTYVSELTQEELYYEALAHGEGNLNDGGVLCVDTGKFTGRSPKDRFIVRDEGTETTVNWSAVNKEISAEHFDTLFQRMIASMAGKIFYRRSVTVCADPAWKLNLDVVTEFAFQDLFVRNLFVEPGDMFPKPEQSSWRILAIPSFRAKPLLEGTLAENFTIINFSKRAILIGGSAYTGEIKKSVFSVLNYLLPKNGVLPMHCSVNVGDDGRSALFFGLSGTGKTTLSADSHRRLVGDDEHGWGSQTVFNFEGGCYAKCISLTPEKEPQIFHAIRPGALLENVSFYPGTYEVDYHSKTKTENSRAAYPLRYIDNAVLPSVAGAPSHIFFLTADAFGVLPPLAYLTTEQAVYHFLSGYTAKVAGTETGVLEPQATFSACFGNAFLTLHPSVYAKMLEDRLKKHRLRVWLINTGWTGGNYATGKRIPLAQTRAMINAILNGSVMESGFKTSPIFRFQVPIAVEGVESSYLNTGAGWESPEDFNTQLEMLATKFNDNFKPFEAFVDEGIRLAAPVLKKSEIALP